MKSNISFILGLITFLFARSSFSQLTVDAGPDTTYCDGLYYGSHILGSEAVIEGNIGPMTYAWETEYTWYNGTVYTAVVFLDDTTKLKPFVIAGIADNQDWKQYILHVTDSIGNTNSDTINIRFSKFGYSVGLDGVDIHRGDSIILGIIYVGGGIEPLEVQWIPAKWLSEPNSIATWCKPDSSITYSQIVTDSVGCVSELTQAIQIRVYQVGIEELGYDQFKSKIYPNPASTSLKIMFDNPEYKPYQLCIFDNLGRQIHMVDDILESQIELDVRLYQPGLYYYKLLNEENRLGFRGKFLIE